jgi:hypothetical protein
MSTARSLTEIVKASGKIKSLVMVASKDLVCMNMWCEKVTGPCICRLERAIQKMDTELLQEVDLSGNKLTALPPSFSSLTNLRKVNISDNDFTEKPAILADLEASHSLEEIVDHANPYSST